MLSAREYVEIMTCRRLNKILPNDKEVDNVEFNNLMSELEDLTNSFARNNHITGFTEDDLRGFFAMQAHKTLRRGMYDKKRPPFGFFKTIFNNLLKNLHRDMENTSEKLIDSPDLLDLVVDCEFSPDSWWLTA